MTPPPLRTLGRTIFEEEKNIELQIIFCKLLLTQMMTLMMMTKWRQMVLKTTMTNMRITPRIFLSGSNLCSSERSPTPEINISYLSSILASSILSQIYFVKGHRFWHFPSIWSLFSSSFCHRFWHSFHQLKMWFLKSRWNVWLRIIFPCVQDVKYKITRPRARSRNPEGP